MKTPSFASHSGLSNLETGKQSQTFREDNQLWSSNNEELTVSILRGCNVVVAGCYGEGTGIPLEMAENGAAETLSVVVERLNRTMELTEDGKMLTNYVDYLQYMGTDAWVDCASISSQTPWRMPMRKSAWRPWSACTTILVIGCPRMAPKTTRRRGNLATKVMKGSAKTIPITSGADPCCNTRLQETMCCAPKNATVSVFNRSSRRRITFLSASPWLSRTARRKRPRVATSTLWPAWTRLKPPPPLILSPRSCRIQLCMTKYLEVNKITTEINSDLECCLNAVVGKESWENGYSMKSTQPCSTDDDCESGKCVITTGDQKDAPKDQLKDPCKWTTVEHPNRCAIAGADTSGTSIAKCLLRRLTTNPKVTEEAVKTVQKVLGGSSDASDADVGKTIMAGALTNTCMGDGNAHLFDQYCWGSACSDCEATPSAKLRVKGLRPATGSREAITDGVRRTRLG